MNDAEATRQQALPEGQVDESIRKDITNIAKSDLLTKFFLTPENGDETVELWVRSSILYIKAKRLHIQMSDPADMQRLIQSVSDDLEARAQMGMKKYGERLTTFNGRNAELDKLQELYDTWVYSIQQREEK